MLRTVSKGIKKIDGHAKKIRVPFLKRKFHRKIKDKENKWVWYYDLLITF